jgi:hypothetical protein
MTQLWMRDLYGVAESATAALLPHLTGAGFTYLDHSSTVLLVEGQVAMFTQEDLGLIVEVGPDGYAITYPCPLGSSGELMLPPTTPPLTAAVVALGLADCLRARAAFLPGDTVRLARPAPDIDPGRICTVAQVQPDVARAKLETGVWWDYHDLIRVDRPAPVIGSNRP